MDTVVEGRRQGASGESSSLRAENDPEFGAKDTLLLDDSDWTPKLAEAKLDSTSIAVRLLECCEGTSVLVEAVYDSFRGGRKEERFGELEVSLMVSIEAWKCLQLLILKEYHGCL